MIPKDQLTVIISIFLAIPLCFILRRLKPPYRKYYSFILGTIFQFLIYGTDVWIPFLNHIVIYLVIVLKGRKCGFLVTVLGITGYSIYNLVNMFIAYASWSVDVTALLMGNVCKYSLFAYAYQDGGVPDEQLKTAEQRKEKMT